MVKPLAVLVTAYFLLVGLAGWGVFGRLSAAPTPEQWQADAWRDEATSTLRANHIVYDPVRDRLYASVPASDPNRGNSVVWMAPNGRTSEPIPVGIEPNVLALSTGAEYLYVGLDGTGTVRRLNLASQILDPHWSLGSDLTCGIYVATDMVVLINDPNAVAVARDNPCWSRHAGVAVFDSGAVRPNTTPPGNGNTAIEPSADPHKLFGLDTDSPQRRVQALGVTADGVAVDDVVPDLLTSSVDDFLHHNGRLYMSNGDVLDGADLSYEGQFEVVGSTAPPVVQDDRAYFLIYRAAAGRYEVLLFDSQTFEFQASTLVSGLQDEQPGQPIEFIAAGRNRMGVRVGDGRVYWLLVQIVQYTSYLPVVIPW